MFRPPDIFPPRQMAANRLIWMTLLLICGQELAIARFADLEIVVAYAPMFVYIFATCALISLFYRYVMHEKALFMFGETIAQILCTSFVIMIAVLLGARMNLPLIDDALMKIDHFLGFDWRHHAAWLNDQPAWFNAFLAFCYQSYGMQAVILVPALFIRRQSDQAQRFVMVFLFTGMVTALLSALLPAEAMFLHFGIDPAAYPNLEPAAALLHQPELLAMRHHTTNMLVYPGMGLVTFPSFHTSMGVILIYVAINLPLLRLVAIPLNLGMIFSTPFHGGHYLVDIIAGIVIAFIGIYGAERVLPPRSQAASALLNQLGSAAERTPPS